MADPQNEKECLSQESSPVNKRMLDDENKPDHDQILTTRNWESSPVSHSPSNHQDKLYLWPQHNTGISVHNSPWDLNRGKYSSEIDEPLDLRIHCALTT